MNVGDLVDAGFAEIKTGPFGTQLRASDYVSVGRPVLNVRNVGFGDVRPKDLEYVNEETAQRLSTHLLTVNDIVFGRKGAVERHAFIRDKFDGAMQGSDCIRLRVSDSSPMPARFITFVLRTKQHQSWMQSFCSHGATMASLNQDIVRQIPLPEIDPDHQELAVAVLQNIDDLIENARRRVEVLEEMARTIYREWFVKFRYPGHEDVSLVDSALGPIPDAWTVTTLGQSAQWFSGGTPRTKVAEYWGGKLPWITSGTLTSMLLDRSDRTLTELGASNGTRIVNRDALLFVVRGMSLAKEFRVGIADTRLAFGQDVKALVASPEVEPMYLAFSVITRADEIQRMVEFAGHGTGKLSTDRVQAMEIPKPPLGLQKSFADTISPLRESMSALRLGTDHLEGLRDLLLPKLVSGQIDISSLDLDALVGDQVA